MIAKTGSQASRSATHRPPVGAVSRPGTRPGSRPAELTVTRGARITAVTAVAAGTAGAGALLSLLREGSGSLAAPVVLHLAANCVAPLASALAGSCHHRSFGLRVLSPVGDITLYRY
jgi:hypothetical protein